MFYQVRIINPNGTVKKIISNAELSKIHWNKFQALAGKNKTNVLENKFNLKGKRTRLNKIVVNGRLNYTQI